MCVRMGDGQIRRGSEIWGKFGSWAGTRVRIRIRVRACAREIAGQIAGRGGVAPMPTRRCAVGFPRGARCEVQGAWRGVRRASVLVARATRTLPWAKARAGAVAGAGRGPGDELPDMEAGGREAGLAGLGGNAASGRARELRGSICWESLLAVGRVCLAERVSPAPTVRFKRPRAARSVWAVRVHGPVTERIPREVGQLLPARADAQALPALAQAVRLRPAAVCLSLFLRLHRPRYDV